MALTADKTADLTILHQIGLQRFSVGVVKRIRSVLRRMQVDIEAQIRERLSSGDNAARDASSFRLSSLLQQVRSTQGEAHRVIRSEFDREIQEAVAAEADFITGMARLQVGTEVSLASVSAQQLEAAVVTHPLQGKTLRQWTAQLETGDVSRVQGQITMGYLEGESVPQVVRRVRQVATVTERGAETLVRTSMTHINARAVERNAAANPGLFERYQWVSVLDNRTTPVCRARAGKAFSHGSGPLPPAHAGCRSTVFSLVPGVGPAEDIGYEDWLKRQDAATQQDILGAARYKLWKQGGIKLDGFVDGGRTLTLDQLKARDAAAFQKAGL
jgi:SPP1 gp7 family putative phage head morphogenesis protein